LDHHFPNQELMNVSGVVSLHYCLVAKPETSFPLQLEVIIFFYYMPKKVGKLLVPTPLNKFKLESQVSFFKMTMLHNLNEILKKDGKECNHLKSMWFFISTSKLLTQPPLSMWSLPNLPCAKFWDLLKMNVASTFCF